jgi:hypothetical protein
VAGSTTFSADVVDVQLVAMGWSAKKQILGTSVYNDADELVGKIDDIIVARTVRCPRRSSALAASLASAGTRSPSRVVFPAGRGQARPAPARRTARSSIAAGFKYAGGK